MLENTIQLVCAFLGSLGFSLIFNIRKEKLLAAGFGGLLSWGVYLILGNLISGNVIRTFIASLALTLYAEIMARVKRSPATVFLVTAAIPLMPGGSLYMTMSYAMEKRWTDFTSQGIDTLLLAAAIAGGILCMTTCLRILEKTAALVSRKGGSSSVKALKAAFPHTIPVLTGFLALGMAYGVLMQTKGYGVIWSVLMSAIAFGGSMQYVAITLLTTAFDPLQAFLMSIMVNARHLFYGISMLGKYKGLGKIRPFLIFTLCDETFSVSYAVNPPEEVERKYFYFWISFLDYFYWILGTFLGGVLGSFVTFNTEGLDFALTALFVVLFLEQWKVKDNRPAGIIGIICAVISLLIFGSDNLVIPAMVLILVSLLAGRRYIRKS